MALLLTWPSNRMIDSFRCDLRTCFLSSTIPIECRGTASVPVAIRPSFGSVEGACSDSVVGSKQATCSNGGRLGGRRRGHLASVKRCWPQNPRSSLSFFVARRLGAEIVYCTQTRRTRNAFMQARRKKVHRTIHKARRLHGDSRVS